MKKTTVYLSEDAAFSLRRLALVTGRPQAELVREAVEGYVAEKLPKRKFLSAGAGRSNRPEGTSIADDEEDLLLEGITRESGWERT